MPPWNCELWGDEGIASAAAADEGPNDCAIPTDVLAIQAALDNPDPRLRSGMFARVSLSVGERQAILVPNQAVIRRGQLTGVWVVRQDGTAHLRWVRLGRSFGDSIEILSGMQGDEIVVLSTQQPLIEGDRVVK